MLDIRHMNWGCRKQIIPGSVQEAHYIGKETLKLYVHYKECTNQALDIRSGATTSLDFVSHNYIQLPHYTMVEKYRIIQRTFL